MNTSISILIDPGAYRSYVLPKIVDVCKIEKIKHDKPLLFQLSTGIKWKVSEVVKYCKVNLNGFPMKVNLNIPPLGSDDILIDMK